jgi:secondary thiamine-phosphate synthase enzyme
MPVETKYISISTRGFGDILDITDKVSRLLGESKLTNGIVTVFISGSTGAVTSIEYEPGVVQDLKEAIERMVPPGISYHHDRRWGDGNGNAHVSAALVGASFTVPFSNKSLMLGTWQQIIVIDFDNRPRNRKITVQIIGE